MLIKIEDKAVELLKNCHLHGDKVYLQKSAINKEYTLDDIQASLKEYGLIYDQPIDPSGHTALFLTQAGRKVCEKLNKYY